MASETQAPEVCHYLIRGMPMRPLHHVCAVAPMWCALKYPETCLPLGIDPSGVSQVAGHVAMAYLEAMASDGVFWAIALRCLGLAFASLVWTVCDGLPGDEGVGRCLLGHRAALPNAGFRQPVLALCRWRSGGAWSLPFAQSGWLGLFIGTGDCSSLHASQLATVPVRVDLRVAPGHLFDPSADDRAGSRRA